MMTWVREARSGVTPPGDGGVEMANKATRDAFIGMRSAWSMSAEAETLRSVLLLRLCTD